MLSKNVIALKHLSSAPLGMGCRPNQDRTVARGALPTPQQSSLSRRVERSDWRERSESAVFGWGLLPVKRSLISLATASSSFRPLMPAAAAIAREDVSARRFSLVQL